MNQEREILSGQLLMLNAGTVLYVDQIKAIRRSNYIDRTITFPDDTVALVIADAVCENRISIMNVNVVTQYGVGWVFAFPSEIVL